VITGTRRKKRLIYWVLLIVAILVLGFLYVEGVFTPAIQVHVATVSQVYPSQAFTMLNASGYVVAQRKSALASKVTGRLIWLGVEEGIDGLVHISDISWTQRIKHPADLFKKGQEVEAVVLHIDKENERFSLGVKQLTEDPWEKVGDKYLTGSAVKGGITGITDFGVFLELEPGVEGLIHTSELDIKKGVKIGDVLKLGDELEAEILVVDPKNRKLTLSQRALGKRREKEDIDKYTQDQGSGNPTLGDIMEKNKK
jgi:small subunit ribosomal protein S1